MDEQQCLRRYIELEQQIRRSELNNPIQMLQMKNFRLQRLLCELEAAQKELDVYEKLVWVAFTINCVAYIYLLFSSRYTRLISFTFNLCFNWKRIDTDLHCYLCF